MAKSKKKTVSPLDASAGKGVKKKKEKKQRKGPLVAIITGMVLICSLLVLVIILLTNALNGNYFPESTLDEVPTGDVKTFESGFAKTQIIFSNMSSYQLCSARINTQFDYSQEIWGDFYSYTYDAHIFVMPAQSDSLEADLETIYGDDILTSISKNVCLYEEKITDTGYFYNYPARYSTGILENELAMESKKTYLVAYVLKVTDNKKVTFVATVDECKKLPAIKTMLETFIYYAMDETVEQTSLPEQTSPSEEVTQTSEQEETEQNETDPPKTEDSVSQNMEPENVGVGDNAKDDIVNGVSMKEVAEYEPNTFSVGDSTYRYNDSWDYNIDIDEQYELFGVDYIYADASKNPDTCVLISPLNEVFNATSVTPGKYSFQLENPMAGRWVLSVKSSESLGGAYYLAGEVVPMEEHTGTDPD